MLPFTGPRWSPAEGNMRGFAPAPHKGAHPLDPIDFLKCLTLAPPPFFLTIRPFPAILRARMENQTTNIDLSALDTEAMRSRLSELGSYL